MMPRLDESDELRFLESEETPNLRRYSDDKDAAASPAPTTYNNTAIWDGATELDTYSLMFLANFQSPSFLFSVMIFILQMSMLLLTLIDQLREPQPYNLLKIPINNPVSQNDY